MYKFRYIFIYGKKVCHCQSIKKTKIQKPRGAAMFSLRQKARLYARFRPVPDLFSGVRQ